MHSFIPHRDNPHTGRKFIGIVIILVISAAGAYFAQKSLAQSEMKTQILQQESISSQVNNPTESAEISAAEFLQEANDAPVKQSKDESVIIDDAKIGMTLEEAKAPVPAGPRSKDPKIALEEAKTFARPQITEGKYIDVSLSHQNMVLFENGKFVDAYLISSGKKGMETPLGTYHIQNKVPRAYSKSYGLYMPNWMALVSSGSFGIHELPEWPGGYKEGAAHLGIPVSHGCVRLGVGPAKRVYDWADVGTIVIIHK